MKFGRSTGGGKKFWCIIWRDLHEICRLSCSNLSICGWDFRLMTKHFFFSKKYFFVTNRKSNPQIDIWAAQSIDLVEISSNYASQFFSDACRPSKFHFNKFCIFHFSCCFWCFSNLRKINKKIQKKWKKH